MRLTAAGTVTVACLQPGFLCAEPPLRFDFHSAFWMNLHHRLYIQSQAYEAARRGETLDSKQGVWDAAAAAAWAEYRALSSSQRLVWERALAIYAGG